MLPRKRSPPPKTQQPRNDYTINLLLVCRQIHHDASLMPYRLNVFSFNNEKMFRNRFLASLNASQKQALRAIFVQWETQKKLAKNLTGLEAVYRLNTILGGSWSKGKWSSRDVKVIMVEYFGNPVDQVFIEMADFNKA